MDVTDKVRILADAAKYDVSCASSGSERKGQPGMVGSAAAGGICHSWTADGRCVSLLKLLYTNACQYDCAYCVNRRSNDIPRASFTPDEVAKLTMAFYRRNYIEGLFLSSAVAVNADHTMERLIRVAELLRHQERFNGYIHMKVIPGADPTLIRRLGYLVDRVSTNVEFATNEELRLLAPDKQPQGIQSAMLSIRSEQMSLLPALRTHTQVPRFVPAGQSTQMIVGAGRSDDRDILLRAESLYRHMQMKRVYYSAYVPVNPLALPGAAVATPLLREHRVYQADWLLRFYGFEAAEILGHRTLLDLQVDPKAAWAVDNYHLFPLDVNTAPLEMLLRVPGIGMTSARRIIASRRQARLTYDSLKKTGAVMKRARHFLTADGRRPYTLTDDAQRVYLSLTHQDGSGFEQLSFLEAV